VRRVAEKLGVIPAGRHISDRIPCLVVVFQGWRRQCQTLTRRRRLVRNGVGGKTRPLAGAGVLGMLAFVLVLLAGCGGSADPYSGDWVSLTNPPLNPTPGLMTIEKKEDDEWIVRLGEYWPGVGWGKELVFREVGGELRLGDRSVIRRAGDRLALIGLPGAEPLYFVRRPTPAASASP